MAKVTHQQGSFDFPENCPSLLDALEQQQVKPAFHCREGFCGACRCKLIAGEVEYQVEPLAFIRKGEFLLCCSKPKTDVTIELVG